MKISVCMGVYNGEKYIEKQLDSILKQGCKPDEVIVCDDNSQDATVQIIERFISKNGLEDSWKLYQNTDNKGYPGNFYYAMGLCSGDVVFLADQDDLWVSDKLENMVRILTEHPEIELLASKWGIIDEKDNVLKEISRGKLQTEEICEKITFSQILYCYDWPGMCMCYRKAFGAKALERVKNSKLPHDLALGLMAAEENAFFCVHQLNQYHRRHEANVAMEEHRVRKLLNKERKMFEIQLYIEKMQEVLASNCLSKEENIAIIRRKEALMQERMTNLAYGYRMKMIKQYLKNRQEIRLATLICDILICKKNEKDGK